MKTQRSDVSIENIAIGYLHINWFICIVACIAINLSHINYDEPFFCGELSMYGLRILQSTVYSLHGICWLHHCAVLYSCRLKRRMEEQIGTLAVEYQEYMSAHISETTKQVIRENSSIDAELKTVSRNLLDVIKDNDRLKEETMTKNERINILEMNEKDLIRKNTHIKKVRIMLPKYTSTIVPLTLTCRILPM